MPEAIRKVGYDRFIGFLQGFLVSELYYDQSKRIYKREKNLEVRMNSLLENIKNRIDNLETSINKPMEKMRQESQGLNLNMNYAGVIMIRNNSQL